MNNKRINNLLKSKQFVNVQLGGGEDADPVFINIDKRDLPNVDIIHDLETYPWPLPDNSVDFLIASHLVEHINPAGGGFIKFMDECWRVLKPDKQFLIATPYANSYEYYADPTHCNPCNEATFLYFDPLEVNTNGLLYKEYRPKPWQLKKIAWKENSSMEVMLIKRRDDKTYHELRPII